MPLSEDDGYHIHPDKIAEEISRGSSVILTSNPRNPTGRVVCNPELAEIQAICRGRATLISDEFYSGYNYTSDCDGSTISAAENIEDVNEDDVLIIDGLTKRFRLPGWRIAWILGPKGMQAHFPAPGSRRRWKSNHGVRANPLDNSPEYIKAYATPSPLLWP